MTNETIAKWFWDDKRNFMSRKKARALSFLSFSLFYAISFVILFLSFRVFRGVTIKIGHESKIDFNSKLNLPKIFLPFEAHGLRCTINEREPAAKFNFLNWIHSSHQAIRSRESQFFDCFFVGSGKRVLATENRTRKNCLWKQRPSTETTRYATSSQTPFTCDQREWLQCAAQNGEKNEVKFYQMRQCFMRTMQKEKVIWRKRWRKRGHFSSFFFGFTKIRFPL